MQGGTSLRTPKPQIPFSIFADGQWISGHLIRSSETTWVLDAPGGPVVQVEIKGGEWRSLYQRTPDFVRRLGEWIVAYYE